ncbi:MULTISPECIES: hypothetical protein [unclassified Streptomyces]|uniref:hypothetical protein n=1 Tax=unclassified Streptomyces TaxID=2593676 RepID=UPI00382CF4D1
MLDVITGVVIPGALEVPPDQRRRRVTWTLLTLIAVAALAWAFPYGLDYFSTEQTTRHTKKVEERIDKEDPAFTSIVREDKTEDNRMFILDRPISPAEKKNLFKVNTRQGANFKDLEEIVASHRGHELRVPGLRESDGYTKAWLIDLFSGRDAGLAITGIRAKDLKCRPAAAKTVILFEYGGGGDYEGILFNLSEPDTPLGLEGDGNKGKPYFSHKKVDLGNGATPGGLRTEVSSGIKDCNFIFEAEYRDAEGVHLQDIRNGSGRFDIRGIPADPEQVFVVTLGGIKDCGAHPGPLVPCPHLPFETGRWSIFDN